jgi:hypothetical protein
MESAILAFPSKASQGVPFTPWQLGAQNFLPQMCAPFVLVFKMLALYRTHHGLSIHGIAAETSTPATAELLPLYEMNLIGPHIIEPYSYFCHLLVILEAARVEILQS